MPEIPIRIIPLGGLGEIGKNMMALEYGDEIVVVDAGVQFPEEEMPEIDFVIPDITYLLERSDNVKAILITHGHEDHIGALPYVLKQLNVPVYSSRLAHGLIAVKLREHGLLGDSRLNVVEPNTPFKIGKFLIEFFRVCHSIPDAMGIGITTPLGTIIHTGDFKVDHTPVDGNKTDFSTLLRFASEGVLLLCSDSTYSEVDGYTPSEQIVGEEIERVMSGAEGRVMVATFASLISRMQQVIDAAVKHDRKVTVVGRSMVNNLKMATKMGYLRIPEGTIIPMNVASELPDSEVVVLATGAQGEPTSALVRISNGTHKDIQIVPGDTVIVSASPIPGNETLVSRTIDNLYRQGAQVLYSRIATVHVHGHASREELKLMLSMVKPKNFLPVHGEYRHLVAHADIAVSMGLPENNIYILEDGDILELTSDNGSVIGTIPIAPIYVDGKHIWNVQTETLQDRNKLARNGVVVVSVSLDKENRELLGETGIKSFGYLGDEDKENLFQISSEKVHLALEAKLMDGIKLKEVEQFVSSIVSDHLYSEIGKRPIVIVNIAIL